MKASPLLRAWLRRLDSLGVRVAVRHRWDGWDADGVVRFERSGRPGAVHPAATILALGGASWPRLGSDGGWVRHLPEVAPFRPGQLRVPRRLVGASAQPASPASR